MPLSESTSSYLMFNKIPFSGSPSHSGSKAVLRLIYTALAYRWSIVSPLLIPPSSSLSYSVTCSLGSVLFGELRRQTVPSDTVHWSGLVFLDRCSLKHPFTSCISYKCWFKCHLLSKLFPEYPTENYITSTPALPILISASSSQHL